MPNLVSVDVYHDVRTMITDAILLLHCINEVCDRSRRGWLAQDWRVNVQIGALARSMPWSRAFTHPDAGIPTWQDEIRTRERPGAALTFPHREEVAQRRQNDTLRLRQAYAIAGLKGTAVLTRTVTASGKATRKVPVDVSGLPPIFRTVGIGEQVDETLTDAELRFLRRYRNAMKGEKFAESMAKEARERDRAYWRAASPWLPVDKAGRFMVPMFTSKGIVYSDGTTLKQRMLDYFATHTEEREAIADKSRRNARRMDEIAELMKEQEKDDRAFRKASRKVKHERVTERKAPLFFRHG